MLYYFLIMLLAVSCVYFYKKYSYSKIKRLSTKLQNSKIIFNTLYENTAGIQLSKQDRAVIKDDWSLTYGEICFESFASILTHVESKSGEIFYDLGSGTGKAVIAAALLHPFSKCIGIELLPSLYQASLEKLSMLHNFKNKNLPTIEFIQNDFFKVDLSNANIVFINATGFFGESYDELVSLLKKLHSGTRIIISSKLLPDSDFQLLHQNFYLMSWGMSRVSIYLRS